MEQSLSLDDFMLFLAVADAGGLAGAARATGVSVPTLSRRMTEFERRLGQKLFERGARGYGLTARGRSLWEQGEGLRGASAGLTAFAKGEARQRVRITAGHWTSRFLVRHLTRHWSPRANWMPEFVTSDAALDIARREADIGIRNRRPEQSWLAGRRTAAVQFAVFAISDRITGYIGVGSNDTPSARWLNRNHSDGIVTTANNPRLAVDLALAGIGRIVLPVFAAADMSQLTRVSPIIDELKHDEWLVCHHQSRYDPPIRAALDCLHSILTDCSLRATGH